MMNGIDYRNEVLDENCKGVSACDKWQRSRQFYDADLTDVLTRADLTEAILFIYISSYQTSACYSVLFALIYSNGDSLFWSFVAQ